MWPNLHTFLVTLCVWSRRSVNPRLRIYFKGFFVERFLKGGSLIKPSSNPCAPVSNTIPRTKHREAKTNKTSRALQMRPWGRFYKFLDLSACIDLMSVVYMRWLNQRFQTFFSNFKDFF